MIKLSKNKNLIPVLVLSLSGILISLYLTYTYYSTSGFSFCITGQDCEIVKESAYSSMMGIPVALIGVIGYIAITIVTLFTFTKKRKWMMLFVLSTTGVAFSAYLTYIELFRINAVCSYCVLSAVLMVVILLLVLSMLGSMHPGTSLSNLLIIALVIFGVVVTGAHSIQSSSTMKDLEPSSEFQKGLAEHLGNIGATMYGSFECPHCNHQKELFGQAFSYIDYVECNSRGENANPSLCLAKGIRRYPTWEINGKFYEGMMPLKQLAEISNYNPENP